MFLVNSRLGLVTAAPSGSGRKCLHPNGAPLLPKLRGNFAEFLNEGSLDRLGILYPPTCVGFGTGTRNLPRGFSWRHGFRDFWLYGLTASRLSVDSRRISLPDPPTRLPQDDQRLGSLSLPRPPIGRTVATWYRNINRLSIAYACRPRLRSRLTLRRLALLRNPWAFGGRVSHASFVTHASILTSHASTAGFRRRFSRHGNAPLPLRPIRPKSAASVRVLSPVTSSAHEHLTSELLRTLSRVAASKPTSWLSMHPHIVSHLDTI